MLKGNNKYYLLLLVLFALLVYVEYKMPKPIDWRRTYAAKDKIPFGCNAFYRLANEDIFKGKLQKQNQTPFNVLLESPEKKSAYFFVNSSMNFSKLDCEYLMDFVDQGNDVFIAATDYWGNSIADTFHISTQVDFSFSPLDSTRGYELNFCNPSLKGEKPYKYKRGMHFGYFTTFDTANVEVLARGDDTSTIFLRAKWGEGHFYFLSVPDVFTNYFVVNDSARFFAYKAISYMDAEQIWWDDYFKDFSKKEMSPLQLIFSNDSLYTAWIIAILSLIIFMIFAMKRRQRAIAIVEPLPNTTLQFVEVVGSVYYNARNHKIIAEEKISAFYEVLRAKFSVTSRKSDEETLVRISRLSMIPLEDIKKLFTQIGMVWRQGSITENELIALNKSIENFYKQNKR